MAEDGNFVVVISHSYTVPLAQFAFVCGLTVYIILIKKKSAYETPSSSFIIMTDMEISLVKPLRLLLNTFLIL